MFGALRSAMAFVARHPGSVIGLYALNTATFLLLLAVWALIAPGVGTPVKGGLDYREAHLLMEMLSDSGVMTSLEVVEANPILDDRNASATFAVELVQSAFGKKIL